MYVADAYSVKGQVVARQDGRMDEVTLWACEHCRCRGPKPDEVWHLLTCTDRSDVRPLTFELGHDIRPLF